MLNNFCKKPKLHSEVKFMIKNASLKQKFMVLSIASLAMLSAISWISLKGIGQLDVRINHGKEISEKTTHASTSILIMSDAIKSYILNPEDKSNIKRKENADDEYVKDIQTLIQDLGNSTLIGHLNTLAEMDANELNPVENQVMKLISEGQLEDGKKYLLEVYLPIRDKYEQKFLQFAAEAQNHSAQIIKEATEEKETTILRIIGSMLGGIILSIIANGALFISVINRLTQSLSSTSSIANKLVDRSQSVSKITETVSKGAVTSAEALQETVAAVEELSSMVQLTAKNAREAADLSNQSNQVAENGEVEIKNLIGSMKDIASSSKKISDIINVIDDIAFQTNLLALNAAVEAARAGEQGRGFAVVAEAVRSLAQRSASAAKDITNLIKESSGKVEGGQKTADSAGKVLTDIVKSVKQVLSLSDQIADASREQAAGISQITKTLNELDNNTRMNAKAATEMSSEMSSVKEESQETQNQIISLNSFVTGNKIVANNEFHSKSDRKNNKNQTQLKIVKATIDKKTNINKVKSSEKIKPEQVIPFDDDDFGKVGTTEGF